MAKQNTYFLLIALIALSVFAIGTFCSEFASAQHDPHRNAVREIAKGNTKKATKILEKANSDDSETHFVMMLIAIESNDFAKGLESAKLALKAGLPFERLIAGPKALLSKFHASAEFKTLAAEYAISDLVHGPMVGAVTSDSARIWLRTAQASKVRIVYTKTNLKSPKSTKIASTTSENDFATSIQIDGLESNTRYEYELILDGKKYSGKKLLGEKPYSFTTTVKKYSPSKFNVAFGGGAGFVPKWEHMWKTIHGKNVSAFLTLGDNVYIDDPTHLLTNHYCYYRRQSRPEWRFLTSRVPIFSIYDDHDFGLNDCVPGPEIENPKWKRKVWNTFRQNWANPYYGGGEANPGCWYDFHIGDVHFIMLDGRYYRTLKPNPSMLGDFQKKWLMETLKNSKGKFKVLASPVPWSKGVKPGSKDTWDGFNSEREEIFSHIEKNKIDGVILISADRHRTDLRINRRKGGYDLYEFESSKLTNRHTHPVVKTPDLIWGYNKKCSFGLMKFDTSAKEPTVVFEAVNIDGEIIHEFKLGVSQLTHN